MTPTEQELKKYKRATSLALSFLKLNMRFANSRYKTSGRTSDLAERQAYEKQIKHINAILAEGDNETTKS